MEQRSGNVVEYADAGLYAAKEKGRNRIEHFTPAVKKATPARPQELDLESAVLLSRS